MTFASLGFRQSFTHKPSFVAINLFRRACVTRMDAGGVIAISGIVSGCGIWATHFIAMLAYEPGLPVAYDELLTGLSLLVAVAVMSLALAIAAAGTTRTTALIGGALVGVAVAAMHYIGMLALEVPGRVSWAPDLTITAIVLGILFGHDRDGSSRSARQCRGDVDCHAGAGRRDHRCTAFYRDEFDCDYARIPHGTSLHSR